jgi:uncharacterized protein
MCPQIITSGALNVPALTTDDAYVQIVAPPSFITGTPTDVIGCVGTASWGPVNTPVHLGSGQDAVQQFGAISAAALNDSYDLATELYLAFGQSSAQSTLEAWAVRVTDGTDVKASVALPGAASGTAKTITVTGTITAGDTVTATFTGAGIPGSPVSVAYVVQAGDTLATVASGLAAAINANGALIASGVAALTAAAVVSIYAPAALTYTLAQTTSANATETLTGGVGTTATNGGTIQALYSGTLGNSTQVKIQTGSVVGTFTAVVTPPVGLVEIYPNIPGTNFWAKLAQAVNMGASTIRGPSQCIKLTNVIPAVGAPSTGTYTLANGTDGRAGVNTATMLGSGTAIPPTGLFALANQSPPVGIVWMAGVVDVTAIPTLLQFNLYAGTSSLLSVPTGTSTTAAVALIQGAGGAHPSILGAKDFISFFDTVNNVTRRVPPCCVIAGEWATLGPQQSPGNKQVSLVIGTERNDPILGSYAYSSSEIGQLEAAGITLITNPIPRGRMFGIRHGQTTSPDPVTAPAEYWRMTMYLARSAASFIGQYVDEEQSQDPNDPLRQALKLQSDQFLKRLRDAKQIDRFLTTCAFSASSAAQPGNGINTPASIAAHYLFCLWQVTYLSTVRFLVLSLQGGTTVVDVAGSLQPQSIQL